MGPSSHYLAFLALLFCASCVFKNTDIYVDPVKPPDGSDAALSLESIGGSTLIKPVTVHLKVLPAGKGHYEASIKVDDVIFYSLSSSTGDFYFVLDPAKFGDGEKTLRISVVYPSLSPSLAGQLGAEIITVLQEYKFFVDLVPPDRLKAPVVYLEDGRSMVKWNKPNKFNFTQLILLRMYYKDGLQVARDSIKINDFNTTIFHDASYVGGPVRYRVDLKGYKFYMEGQETDFNVTPLKVKLDSLSLTPSLSWEKSPLYNNDIQVMYENPYFGYPVNQPGSVTTYARIGQPSVAFLYIVSKGNSAVYSTFRYEIRKTIFVGIKIPAFYRGEYVPSQHAYFLLSENYLYKIDDQTFNVTGSLLFASISAAGFVVSRNGLYAYLYNYDRLQRVDLNNMYVTEQIDLTSIIQSWNQGFAYQPSVSDDNHFAFSMYGVQKQFIVDLTSKTVVWDKYGGGLHNPRISPDGQYLYWIDKVYRKRNGNWDTTIGTISNAVNVLGVQFRQDTKEQLIVSMGGYGSPGTYFYDLTSGSVVASATPPLSFSNFNYDANTQSIMIMKTPYGVNYLGEAHVYDANTLEEKRLLESIFAPDNMLYLNGHFFHKTGAILP